MISYQYIISQPKVSAPSVNPISQGCMSNMLLLTTEN